MKCSFTGHEIVLSDSFEYSNPIMQGTQQYRKGPKVQS